MEELALLLYQTKPYLVSAAIPLLNPEFKYSKIIRINNQNHSLIHLASMRDPKILKKIIEFQPDLDVLIEIPHGIPNQCSCVFATPLMLAILSGNLENAKMLVDAGADINKICLSSGHTAASLAICGQRWEIAQLLLNRGGYYELQERKGNFSILERITQLPNTPIKIKEKVFADNYFLSLEQIYPLKTYQNFNWRILPSELFKQLKEFKFIEDVLNLKQKRIKNIIFTKALKQDSINFSFLSFYYIIKELTLNYDMVCNFLENLNMPNFYSWNESEIEYFQQSMHYLLNFYSEKQVFKCLNCSYSEADGDLNLLNGYWQDIYYMFFRLDSREKEIKNYIPDKPKSIVQIHDYMSLALAKDEQENFPLHQENLSKVIGGFIFKDYEILVPQLNYELISLGLEMHICVGNGIYCDKILNKDSEIFILKNEHKKYCIEIDARKKDILDAKSNYNEDMPSQLKSELQDFLNARLWWDGREGT